MRKSRTWEAHTESPEGRWGIPAGSPDPSRPIKCLNFSHICYKVASSARHFTCLLPCTLGSHCPGKGSFLVPRFAAGRLKTAAPAGRKPGSVSLCGQEWQHWANPTDQISLQGCSASPSCRWGHRAGHLHRGSPNVWQQGCLSRYVKLVKGWAAQRKGRALCHCLWSLTRNLGWFGAGVSLRMSKLGSWAEGPWGLYSAPCLYPHQWCCAETQNLMTWWSKQYQTLAFIFCTTDKLLQ